MGLARLGILVNFVSDAVIVGFAAGAGVQIAAGELRHLFGLSFSSSTLFETLEQLALHLAQTNLPTLALGLGTLVVMVVVRALKPKWPAPLISLVAASAVLVALRLDTAGVKVIGALPQQPAAAGAAAALRSAVCRPACARRAGGRGAGVDSNHGRRAHAGRPDRRAAG